MYIRFRLTDWDVMRHRVPNQIHPLRYNAQYLLGCFFCIYPAQSSRITALGSPGCKSAIFLTDYPFLWSLRTCLMIFIFLGCVAMVLKDWLILQDNMNSSKL